MLSILSVLSEDSDCCHILTNFAARIGMLLGPCCANYNSHTVEKLLSLISRLGYILGNIMAKYDTARVQVRYYQYIFFIFKSNM